MAVAGVAVVGCVALAFRDGRGVLAVLALITSALTYAVPTYLRWVPAYGVFSRFEFQTRYCFLPWALTLLVFALGVQTLLDRRRGGLVTRAAVGLLVLVVAVPAVLGANQGRARVPSWRTQAAAERASCRRTLAEPGQAHADKLLAVPPRSSDVVAVPCRRLIHS